MSDYTPVSTKKNHAAFHSHPHSHSEHCQHNHKSVQFATLTDEDNQANPTALPPTAKITRLTLTAMDCPTEAALIRQAFRQHPKVHLLEFDLINRVLSVTHTLEDELEIQTTLIRIGLLEEPSKATPPGAHREWLLLLCSGLAALGAELLDWNAGPPLFTSVIALLAIVFAGTGTLKKGWLALIHFNLNIHLLMSVAVVGAMLIGQFPEAAVVIFLFTLAEKIEAASLDKARDAISALKVHVPESAQVLQMDGKWLETPSQDIRLGQTLRARPGERIALDGVVLQGNSSVNQASITGESQPVSKACGDMLFAGSLNEEGLLEYKVTAPPGSTTLDRIALTIQQAQQQRAPAERMIDAFAKIYTPCVFVFAVMIAILTPLIFGSSWHDSIYKALVLLVIACPCALVISTPVTVVSAMTNAARRGIVIKGGRYLELARHLNTIAFDKTGTLTVGKPQLNTIFTLSDLAEERCLLIAASLNHLSQHPIANALVEAQTARSTELLSVDQFESIIGYGVGGSLQNIRYFLGNVRLMQQANITLTSTDQNHITQLEQQGNTVVILGQLQANGQNCALALFSLNDQVREESKATLAQLHKIGINTVMLTGDNHASAESIAKQLGMAHFYSDLLPEDKLAIISDLQKNGPIAMLGDGINDAPALARADLGITLGAAGSATALEVADIALMQDDLAKIPVLIRISGHCSAVLKQNISIALGIKACFFTLTLLGHANLWMAVFADLGASLIVIFNGLRLLKLK